MWLLLSQKCNNISVACCDSSCREWVDIQGQGYESLIPVINNYKQKISLNTFFNGSANGSISYHLTLYFPAFYSLFWALYEKLWTFSISPCFHLSLATDINILWTYFQMDWIAFIAKINAIVVWEWSKFNQLRVLETRSLSVYEYPRFFLCFYSLGETREELQLTRRFPLNDPKY